LDVERETLLVGVEVEEDGGLLGVVDGAPRTLVSRWVTLWGLDLDDPRSRIGEQFAAVRESGTVASLDDEQSGQDGHRALRSIRAIGARLGRNVTPVIQARRAVGETTLRSGER